MSETVRAFIAVQIPEEVSEAIERIQDHLKQRPEMRDLRWVDPEDAHITIKFLGDTKVPFLPEIVDALDEVAERWEPFSVQMSDLGAFPDVFRPSVLWLGVEEGQKPFGHLYNAVEVALKQIGIKPERREFHPHLTLARVPRSFSQEQRQAVGDLIGTLDIPPVPAFTADAVALIRSMLAPEGPYYIRLAESCFGEPPPLQDDDWEDIPDDEPFE